MNSFDEVVKKQLAAEETARHAWDKREQQKDEHGRQNVDAFIRYMKDNGIEAAPIPPKMTYTDKKTWRGQKRIEIREAYPLPGWSAMVAYGEMSGDWICVYILTDGSVVEGQHFGQGGGYTTPGRLFDTEALAAHARKIVASRNPHYSVAP